MLLVCSSCSITNFFTPKANVLKEPSAFRSVVKGADFEALSENILDFSADFTRESTKVLDNKRDNFTVSPLSMFSALAVATPCSNGNTKTELLSGLKTTESLLTSEFGNLFAESNYLRTLGGESNKIVKKEELTNSIWIDKNVEFKTDMLNLLADKFYAYSVSVDYRHENKKANRQMSKFVEEKTNGLLTPNFDFDPDTLFTILNTLYLKSLWNSTSDNLSTSNDQFEFVNRDGSKVKKNLLETFYQEGRIQRTEAYSSFFAETECKDRIKFVVPNDGYKLEDILTTETLFEINKQKYHGFDEENNTMYFGKTFFPGFEAECDIDAKNILKTLGIRDLFSDSKCDFSNLTDEFVYCDKVEHVAKLKVDKKGIEGAAYTAMQFKGESAPEPPTYKEVYEEFVVDKAFYFVVSDHNNLPLFSGIVNKI